MQTSRIIPGNWYVTKQGQGKCESTGKRLLFLIDGQKVWLSSSDVQHEIAKGEEPHPEEDKDQPDEVANNKVKEQFEKATLYREEQETAECVAMVTPEPPKTAMLIEEIIRLKAEITDLKQVNTDLLKTCEKAILWINERAENDSTDPTESSAPGFLHNMVSKCKGEKS